MIPFIIGISLSPASNLFLFSLLLVSWATLLLVEKFRFAGKWNNRKYTGLLLQLHFFLLGLNCSFKYQDYKVDQANANTFIVHLQQLDIGNENYNRFVSTVYYKKDDSLVAKVLCYTYISTNIQHLNAGTVFITQKRPARIKSLYNPGSFDFAAYAKRKNISHTMNINNNLDVVFISYKKELLLNTLFKIRKWIVYTIQAKIKNGSEAGLTEALLIGYKEDLDKTLQEQYTATGVSHIIAVSGMHLGLIFHMLTNLIGLFIRKKTSRIIGLSFILPLLWAFALITGASASVLRSVVVFTIMLLGNALLKKAGSINALLASAFFILLIQPLMITDIGFQLSYAAVLSIIVFEPIISRWLYIKNKILTYLWNMIAITIAAQILTTPIVLYHFKQFPIFFLITNLVAVPLSSLVLLLGIGLCLLSLVNLPTALLAESIHLCLSGMNNYIGKIAAIPFNSIQASISFFTVVLCYALIVITTLTLTANKIRFIIFPMIIILLLGISHHLHRYRQFKKRELIVTYLKNETLIVHQHGKSAQLYCSRSYSRDRIKLRRFISQVSHQLGIQHCQIVLFEDQPALIRLKVPFSKNPIWVLHALDKSLAQLKQLGMDDLAQAMLIADGSNKLWKIRQWEKQAHELHLRLYSTQEKGAFILPCKQE